MPDIPFSLEPAAPRLALPPDFDRALSALPVTLGTRRHQDKWLRLHYSLTLDLLRYIFGTRPFLLSEAVLPFLSLNPRYSASTTASHLRAVLRTASALGAAHRRAYHWQLTPPPSYHVEPIP